jgi:hypothetical protein
MNLFGLNPLRAIRERIGAALAITAFSIACCVGGLVMTFVFAPQQAVKTNRISGLPVMNADSVRTATAGNSLLITGVLHGDPQQVGEYDFIAYGGERWDVTVPTGVDDSYSEPHGRWASILPVVPELALDLDEQLVMIHAASHVRLNGALHDTVVPGESALTANDQGEPVSDGTIKYHGLVDGDLATVFGKKAADGGLDPEEIFAGDRAAFEESQRQAVSGFLISGIFMIFMTPVIFFGGLLLAIFKRR